MLPRERWGLFFYKTLESAKNKYIFFHLRVLMMFVKDSTETERKEVIGNKEHITKHYWISKHNLYDYELA